MKISSIGVGIGFLLSLSVPGLAQASPSARLAGEAYVITQSYKMSQERGNGTSGSSSGRDTLVERVIAQRADGVELEYDLPIDATPEDRARNWQLPARVLKMTDGQMQLLNSDQLEDRLTAWLKAANRDRSVCGRLIFTWNAFRIECNPQSIISKIEAVDLTTQELREGASYKDKRSSAAGRLSRKGSESNGMIFVANMQVDPDKIRLEQAETDVAFAEMMQKTISLEAALRERSKEQVSGSITVFWETDAAGSARKRTKTTVIETKQPDGTVEKRTEIELVERQPTDK